MLKKLVMNKIVFTFFLLWFFSFPAFSQEKHHSKEKELREFKMKFLAQEMELKEDQKNKFYTLYQEMSDRMKEVYKESVAMKRKISGMQDVSEDDYKKLRDAEQKAADQAKEIEKEYDKKFSEFLTQKQLYKLKEAEKEFRNKIKEMRHNKLPAREKKPVGKIPAK